MWHTLVVSFMPSPPSSRGNNRSWTGRLRLEWIHQSPGMESVRVPFLLTVACADDLPPERFQALLEEQRALHPDRLEGYLVQREQLAAQTRGHARLAARDWLERLPGLPGTDD